MRDKAEDLSLGKTTETELKEDPILQNVLKTIEKENHLRESLQTFTNTSSEIGDVRAISCCAFQPSPTPSLVLTGSWTGFCKLWDATTQKESLLFSGLFFFSFKTQPQTSFFVSFNGTVSRKIFFPTDFLVEKSFLYLKIGV